jgi:hypothetical protein
LIGLAVTDVEVYKDGSVTQRSSDAGYTLLDTDGIDFDGVTGIHGLSISLADNTDAGFWTAGSHYRVVISSVTINTQTVTFTAATFRIGYPAATINTTIATLAGQTSFTLTAGPAEDDALNGCTVIIHDVASAVQIGHAIIQDYTGSTKTVTLVAGVTFTAAAGDNISIFPPALQPTTWGRTLGLESDGHGHADVKEVGGNSTVPTNLIVVYATDFATNYDTTLDMWNVDVTYIAGIAAPTPVTGTADSGTTLTMVDAARTEADADYWKDSWILFTSGTISGQCRLITAFDAGTDTITFSPATTQAVSTNTYEIIPAGRVDAGLIAGQTITAAAGVTFPTSVASPTNITAGTITTVTNLTNAPTAGDLTSTMKASVNTEVLDVLNTDTFAEPGQGTPSATTTLVQKIGFLFKAWRNRTTQTASEYALYSDDAVTKDQEAVVSDDGTTTTRGEVSTGA